MARDVLIVGGGIIGLSTAHYLVQEGASVTVLSRDPVRVGSSTGNAGMIVPSHVIPLAAPGVIAQGLRWLLRRDSPFHIAPRLNIELIRWLLDFRSFCTAEHVARAVGPLRDLSLASVDCFDDMHGTLGDFGLGKTGLMMVYRTEKYRSSNFEAADIAEEAGLRIKRLNREQLLDIEPNLRSEATGAVLYEDDGRVDPQRLVAALADGIRSGGGEIREGVSVSKVESGRAHTDAGVFESEHLVLAAGAWSNALIDSPRLPLQPAKGYSITIPAPTNGPSIPMILSEEKVTITPMPGRLRFGGTLSLAGFDGSVDTQRAEPIKRTARDYGDSVEVNDQPVWSGFRPCSPDGLPIIGAVRPGVWVATGHGMMGLSLGPATGRMMADLIAGRKPAVDVRPFNPERFS